MSLQPASDAPATPIEPRMDHLVLATGNLAATVAKFAEVTGVTAVPGGRHLGQGSRNFLVGFGGTSYLEIVGPDPEHPADAGRTVPFGVDTLGAPVLIAWAVHPDDVDAAATASAAAGADLGSVGEMSRETPEGDVLAWRIASALPPPLDGVTPFLIDWGTTAHPAASLEAELTLVGFTVSHPEPDRIRTVLAAIGVRAEIEAGPPGLRAVLDTPQGRFVLA